MQKSGHPFEIRVATRALHDVVNLINRRRARFPKCPGAILAKIFHQRAQALIGHVSQMRRGMPGVGGRATLPVQQRDLRAFAFQQPRRRDTREPRADNYDIDIEVIGNGWKFRKCFGKTASDATLFA